jgi:hypothetical protein
MLSKEAILNCQDIKVEKVDVPEWGDFVYVRTISSRAQDEWIESVRGKLDTNATAKYLTMCICDEAGKLLFSPNDAEALGSRAARANNALFKVASRLNGLSSEDAKELEKNLSKTQDAGSVSD